MERREIVESYLSMIGVDYECYEHPEAPTIEIAKEYWSKLPPSLHCKNIFLRNHKGNRHYLVIFDCSQSLAIRDLEQRLGQGKLSFASEERMERYLGLKPGSVSPFGLINDIENHTYLFADKSILEADYVSFHPNDNRYSLRITKDNLLKYLDSIGNSYEFTTLY